MQKIKIHQIGGYALKNYILETDMGFIAIDTGYPNSYQNFVSQFQRIAPLTDLKWVFLTHSHDDHAGFLMELMKKTDVKVLAHIQSVPALEKGENIPASNGGYSSRGGYLFGVIKKEFKYPAVKLRDSDILISSEQEQPFLDIGLPLRIVFLPGHTLDSIGLWNEGTKGFFVGDAAMNAIISAKYHTIWIDNIEEYQKSWDKIIAMNPSKVYPSHGTPFDVSMLVKHRDYMKNRHLIM